MPDKTAIHNGLTCSFTEADHSYRIKETGDLLTSVTTLIKKFTPEFNAPAMAKQMVERQNPKYAGMTAEEIQGQWKAKGDLAAREGTMIHELLERWPTSGPWGWHPKTYRTLLMGKQVAALFPKLLTRFRIVAAEQIVFSAKFGLAGQVDLIMADDRTKEGIILDWKTNEKITDETGAFGNLLPPVDHLKNCDVVKYGLQLGLYEKMLEDEGYYPEFKGYRKSIIHVQETFGKVVKVDNYGKEIECLLTSKQN